MLGIFPGWDGQVIQEVEQRNCRIGITYQEWEQKLNGKMLLKYGATKWVKEDKNERWYVDVSINGEYIIVDGILTWDKLVWMRLRKGQLASLWHYFEMNVLLKLWRLVGKIDWPADNGWHIADAISSGRVKAVSDGSVKGGMGSHTWTTATGWEDKAITQRGQSMGL